MTIHLISLFSLTRVEEDSVIWHLRLDPFPFISIRLFILSFLFNLLAQPSCLSYLRLLIDVNFNIKMQVKCVPDNYLLRGLIKL